LRSWQPAPVARASESRKSSKEENMGKLDLSLARRSCAVFALCAATAIALPAQTFRVLHSFDGVDGSNPNAQVIQATDGNLYGTTSNGGGNGGGSVFRITPGTGLTTLYSFCSQTNCADGLNPSSALVQAIDGNLYGTATVGGANGNYGTVFKLTLAGTLTVLHSFCSETDCADGSSPPAELVQGTDGKFYGTTELGGTAGFGSVFMITPGGTLTTLHSFAGYPTEGESPYAAPIQGPDGSLYGTTGWGGAPSGVGTVFRITPSGTLIVLYDFCSQFECADGAGPYAGLVQGPDGNFYSTTFFGGAHDGGTVFNIAPNGTLTTLYSFCSQYGCADGAGPG
jgi:uncharacterized repeat protein (TIGR03803 family)